MKAQLLATWFGVALLTSCFVVFSIDEQQARIKQHRVAWLIAKLESNEPRWQEWAADRLVEIGLPALQSLRAALADEQLAGYRERFQEVINRLAIYEPGAGELVNGLQLRLAADADAIRPGESVTFTTTVCNLEDEPMLLPARQLAFFADGHAFRRVPETSGRAGDLELQPLADVPSAINALVLRRRMYFYRVSENDSIPARSSRPFTMIAHLREENGRCFFQFGDDKTRRLEVPAGGVARFRMAFKNEDAEQMVIVWSGSSGARISPSGGRIAEKEPGRWTGTARSNDVLLRILPAPPGYLPPAQASPPPGPGQIVFVPGK